GALAAFGTLTLTASTSEHNDAKGGPWNGTGPTNTPAGDAGGGALYSARSSLGMTNCTLAYNRGLSGAEILGTLTNGNVIGQRRGGALLVVSNNASLVNLTLAYNQAGSA